MNTGFSTESLPEVHVGAWDSHCLTHGATLSAKEALLAVCSMLSSYKFLHVNPTRSLGMRLHVNIGSSQLKIH